MRNLGFAKVFEVLDYLCVTLRPVDKRSHSFLHDKSPTLLTALKVIPVYNMTILCIEKVMKSRGSGSQMVFRNTGLDFSRRGMRSFWAATADYSCARSIGFAVG